MLKLDLFCILQAVFKRCFCSSSKNT